MSGGSGYIYNNLGLNCNLTTFTDFVCTDGINMLSFFIANDGFSDDSVLVCSNKSFSKNYHSAVMSYKKEINPYFYDLISEEFDDYDD